MNVLSNSTSMACSVFTFTYYVKLYSRIPVLCLNEKVEGYIDRLYIVFEVLVNWYFLHSVSGRLIFSDG